MLRRGVTAIVVLALAGALVMAWTRGTFDDTVTVVAVVDDAGGSLTPGADVKSRGVIVGRTSDLSLSAEGVRLRLVLDAGDARRIPRDAVARILPATVFGTSYVDLVAPDGAVTASLREGQVVDQDRSSRTLELQTTLDSLYRVVTAVKPAELSTTLAAVSSALARLPATQRDRIQGRICFAAQGINPDHYVNACVVPMLDLMQAGDWFAFGGFCIIGKVPSLKPLFYETVDRVLPLLKAKGVTRAHILGVCVADAIRYADAAGKRHGVEMSTDSSSIEVNSVMGKVFDAGRWQQRWSKAEKYVSYHPRDLAHANIETYTRWSGGL